MHMRIHSEMSDSRPLGGEESTNSMSATNLASLLVDSARERAQRTAIKLDDVEVSYEQLDEGSAQVAALLKTKGVSPGDRVGIMLPNVPHFALAYYGVLRAGGVVVPMNVQLKGREVSFYLSDPDARLLFAWHEVAEAAELGASQTGTELITVGPGEFEKLLAQGDADPELVERAGDDTAVILYTSGTTGKPKGAELTHDNLLKNARVSSRLAEASEDAIVLGALPLFHSFGQTCGLNATLSVGGCISMIPRFTPGKALEIIQRDRVTVFQGVPTMFTAMLHHDGREDIDTSSLRLCISGGAAMPVEVMQGFEDAFDCKVLEGYGLSETSPVASFNHPDRERKPGSIGTPIEGVEIKVLSEDGQELEQGEVGELAIRGHNVMKGYWKRPDATEEAIVDDWFHTGDLGKVDEDGYFFIVDRKKEMIIRGGYNVYPREIEEVFYEHPAVLEVAVVGIPDKKMGEEVGAAVVLMQGQQVDEEELKAYIKDEVASYKYPRRIWFVDELPKTATGKILKREVELPDPAPAS
jgi:long-chain acyl-CoA synthetase